jgi:hypothetical protein
VDAPWDEFWKVINERVVQQNQAIEEAVIAAMNEDCGVRVEYGRFDVTKFSAKPDKSVPLGEIHEHLLD